MAPRFSPSSGQRIPLHRKVDEWARQLSILKARRKNGPGNLLVSRQRQSQEYEEVVQRFCGGSLSGRRAFEIGCGQRPYRLINLLAAGVDVRGVDMDVVLLALTSRNAIRCWRENGIERALKTTLRYLIVDRRENKFLLKLFEGERTDPFFEIESRISRGNAADPEVWPDHSVDFIYSEDVFEHISAEDLVNVCKRMAERLSPEGVALIRPMIYTGIKGGHNVEWYVALEGIGRSCPPWDHLLENRYPANTYLNRLWLSDYRNIFSEYFDILEEKVEEPFAGAWAMTGSLKERLSRYPDEELFSNRVRFILKRRRS